VHHPSLIFRSAFEPCLERNRVRFGTRPSDQRGGSRRTPKKKQNATFHPDNVRDAGRNDASRLSARADARVLDAEAGQRTQPRDAHEARAFILIERIHVQM
jgi:hypothetical protein